jgi:hypothetical protein
LLELLKDGLCVVDVHSGEGIEHVDLLLNQDDVAAEGRCEVAGLAHELGCLADEAGDLVDVYQLVQYLCETVDIESDVVDEVLPFLEFLQEVLDDALGGVEVERVVHEGLDGVGEG